MSALSSSNSNSSSDDAGDGPGYAPALWYCPHVEENVNLLKYGGDTKDIEPEDSRCCVCSHLSENWLCLSCHSVHCGRFASAHAKQHYQQTGHCIAVGYEDLSFWCYECDSYLHHLTMKKIYQMYADLHMRKFGEPTVEVVEFNDTTNREGTHEQQQQQQQQAAQPDETSEDVAASLSLTAHLTRSTGKDNKDDDVK